MTDPILIRDFSETPGKAYRVGLLSVLGKWRHELFTSTRAGVLQSMVEITCNDLETGYYGEAPAVWLPLLIDRLREAANDSNDLAYKAHAQEKIASLEKELALAVAVQRLLDQGWGNLVDDPDVTQDDDLNDLFQEGDEHTLFTLLYRYLNTLERKFVIEEIDIF